MITRIGGELHVRLWMRYATLAFTLLALAYIAIVLSLGIRQIIQLGWVSYIQMTLVTLLIYLLAHLIQLIVWLRLISAIHSVGWVDVEIYCRMILLRSLPGGIWHWIGRAAVYKVETATPVGKIVSANLLEWTVLILLGFGIYITTDSTLLNGWGLWLGILLFAIAYTLLVRWQTPTSTLIWRASEAMMWSILYAFTWFLGGLMLFLFVRVSGTDQLNLFQAMRLWCLAGAVSGLIAIVPSGFGLREITLTWLLQPYLTNAIGLLIALLLRLVFLLGDVIWALLGWSVALFAQGKIRIFKVSSPTRTQSDLESEQDKTQKTMPLPNNVKG